MFEAIISSPKHKQICERGEERKAKTINEIDTSS